MAEVTPGPLRFRFGVVGALAPLALFLAGVISLALAGAPDERGFWPVLLVALAAGLLCARDRRAYAEAVVGGMSRPLVALMILAWIVSGVLASLMSASGFIPALTALAAAVDLGGGAFCAAAFLVACVVSTATGTSRRRPDAASGNAAHDPGPGGPVCARPRRRRHDTGGDLQQTWRHA